MRIGKFVVVGGCVGLAIVAAWWIFMASVSPEPSSVYKEGGLVPPPMRPDSQPIEAIAPAEPTPAEVEPALREPIEIVVDDTSALLVPDGDLPDDPAEASAMLTARTQPLLRRRKYAIARATLDRALELDPQNAEAMTTMATLYLRAYDAAKAVNWAKKATVQEPQRAASYLVLGDAHKMAGKVRRARKSWEKGLALDPDNEAFRLRLAGMHVE